MMLGSAFTASIALMRPLMPEGPMLRAFKPASRVMSVWDRAVDAAARMIMRKPAERRVE